MPRSSSEELIYVIVKQPIPTNKVNLVQIEAIPGEDFGQRDPVVVGLSVAIYKEPIYVLMEVSDGYDYIAEDHGLSAAPRA